MATYSVDTNTDIVDAGDGVLGLREALALADATADADSILFANTLFGRQSFATLRRQWSDAECRREEPGTVGAGRDA